MHLMTGNLSFQIEHTASPTSPATATRSAAVMSLVSDMRSSRAACVGLADAWKKRLSRSLRTGSAAHCGAYSSVNGPGESVSSAMACATESACSGALAAPPRADGANAMSPGARGAGRGKQRE